MIISGERHSGGRSDEGTRRSDLENELADFASVVLADTEDVWRDLFREAGRRPGYYRDGEAALLLARELAAESE